MLINLVKNAIKFTKKGQIEIVSSYLKQTEQLRIEVKDSGQGLNQEQIKMLFQEYGRLEGNTKNNSEGIGLGLYICKNLVEQNGGRIWV